MEENKVYEAMIGLVDALEMERELALHYKYRNKSSILELASKFAEIEELSGIDYFGLALALDPVLVKTAEYWLLKNDKADLCVPGNLSLGEQ